MASRKDSRRFGAIDVLPSGKVRARYRDRDGVRHSRSFTGKQAEQAATKWLAAAETDLDRGVQVDHRKSRATFGEFAEHYFETRGGHARTTRARDLVWYRVHIAPIWKSVRFEQIRPESVDSWITQLRKTHVNDDPDRPTLAPATVWDIFVVFRKIILAAQRRGFLTISPIPEDVAEILPKKRRQKALRFLTEAEVTRLARAFNAPWDVLVYVAAYGGLRLGELAALRVEDFDFLRGTVYVDEAVTDVEGILDYGDPKSETSIRTVSLPDEVMALVRQHIETTIGWNSSTAFLFTSAQGMPFRANNWRSRTWSKAVVAAGLAPLTPHDLRHTAASFWIADGADLVQVAERLGHATLSSVRIYAHLLPERDEALRKRQNKRFRRGAKDTDATVAVLRPAVGQRGSASRHPSVV
jgi:integrase